MGGGGGVNNINNLNISILLRCIFFQQYNILCRLSNIYILCNIYMGGRRRKLRRTQDIGTVQVILYVHFLFFNNKCDIYYHYDLIIINNHTNVHTNNYAKIYKQGFGKNLDSYSNYKKLLPKRKMQLQYYIHYTHNPTYIYYIYPRLKLIVVINIYEN